jgi:two-component system, chemotaxis family, chemotaxis protein CheY
LELKEMGSQALHTVVALVPSGGKRLVISQTLRDGGYEVLEASNGREALEIIESTDIHLVVVDMSESDLGTLVFMRCMENDPAYRSVRMVLVTSETQDFKELTGNGVMVSLTRPFTDAQLLSAADALLRVNGFHHRQL